MGSHVSSISSILVVMIGVFTQLTASDAIIIDNAGRQPRGAVLGDHVAVTYANGDAILVATSTDGGKKFTTPLPVGIISRLSVGMRRGPQIALTEKSLVVAGIGAAAGNIQAWSSQDWGVTWSSPVLVNDQLNSAAEGLFSLAAGSADTVWAVWLDTRQKKSQIEISRSVNGGAVWSANSVLYSAPTGSVCECCQPQIATDGKSAVGVMWRNHVGQARDMWLRFSANGGVTFTTPTKLGSGTWNLNACPMDGGGLAIAGKSVQTIWRREGTVFTVAPPATQETSLGEGKNGTILVVEKNIYRAWQKGDRILCSIDGQEPRDLGAGSYPHLSGGVSAEQPVIVVWESGSAVLVQRLNN